MGQESGCLGPCAAAYGFVYMGPVGLLFQCPTHGTWSVMAKTAKDTLQQGHLDLLVLDCTTAD